jgi:hypothetical protein
MSNHVLWTSRPRVGLSVFTDSSLTDAGFAMAATRGSWVKDLPGIARPPRARPRV